MDRFSHVYKGFPPDHCCCDQTVRPLPGGDWLAVFMTGGRHEPEVENFVAACRSGDRGRTWSKAQPVLRYGARGCCLSEVIVHEGEITVFVQAHLGDFIDWRVYSIVSRDNGLTWERPQVFQPLPRRAFIRNLVVGSWGEWLLPYQNYDTMPDAFPSPRDDGSFDRAMNGVLISRDEGRSWERSQETGPTHGWVENNIVELSDGRLIMLIRADGQGALLRSESGDRGRSWSPTSLTDIPNPGAKFRLFRLADGRIALIHNPNPKTRNPLALWISDDDMRTWGYQRVLTDFPGHLQYPDGFLDEEEGYIHFVFDYNRHDVIYWGAKLP